MDCCNDFKPGIIEGVTVCENCFSAVDEVSFERPIMKRDSPKLRNRNFGLLLDKVNFPSYLQFSMLELFRHMERYFSETTRINFIDMNQLAIEMCKVLDYKEYIYLFRPLKTKSRVVQIENFVSSAIDFIPEHYEPLHAMNHFISLIGCDKPLSNLEKVPPSYHIYSSLPSLKS
jgi:hypothetical protein